ncbi:MAG: alpha/beta hydrolase [Methanoregula sp.]|nr:alpha/beta hydrolase [Methanoregula sp.]
MGPEFTITGTLGTYDRVARLKEIAVPVLFTCGEYDEATPTTTAWYRDNLPGSEMIVFEGASHEHHLEKRDEYIAAVRVFLDRAGRRG